MSYLLFPGRHLVNTRFQEDYLQRLLSTRPSALPGLISGRCEVSEPPREIIFAITSANQENSRFNPIPFHVRAMGVDRFARDLRQQVPFRFRVVGIPHYGHTQNFAEFTVKEIANQSEHLIQLTPENCLVLCSTPEVIQLYRALGFAIAPAEAAEPDPKPVTPIAIIREIGDRGAAWQDGPLVKAHLAASHQSLFEDLPEVPLRIARLYQDPLTNQEGSLTETRNYSTYARGMNEIVRLKYLDIRAGIKGGRIVDEGCADGALLAEISRDFPDSDLFGIDLSAEFAGRFHERQRAGEFGGAYVHFFHRNLLDRIFEPESIDTTICNSTLHELWSYGEGEKSVRSYLQEKFRQLRPGGRLIIRDVVGPEDGEREVLLWCSDNDGEDAGTEVLAHHAGRETQWLQQLSSRSRFLLFARDFLGGRMPFPVVETEHEGRPAFRLSLRQAAEFFSKKDYTDNWKSEMNEAFCFWSFAQWKEVLAEIGFQVHENPNNPAEGSRAYTNPWIVEHRYAGHVELLGEGKPSLPWPPTNMVLFAEKRMG
jgi:SAM-dependent methyltransferase